MIVGQKNWYKPPQCAKKFGKVKKSRFLEHFLNPDYLQKSACMAFISAISPFRALYWTWNRSQTTFLDVETYFDTQIVVRDHIKVILVPKSSENLSNRDFLGKATEMMRFRDDKFPTKCNLKCQSGWRNFRKFTWGANMNSTRRIAERPWKHWEFE